MNDPIAKLYLEQVLLEFSAGSVVDVKGKKVRVQGPGSHDGTWIGYELDESGNKTETKVDFRATDVQDRDDNTGDPRNEQTESGGGSACGALSTSGAQEDSTVNEKGSVAPPPPGHKRAPEPDERALGKYDLSKTKLVPNMSHEELQDYRNRLERDPAGWNLDDLKRDVKGRAQMGAGAASGAMAGLDADDELALRDKQKFNDAQSALARRQKMRDLSSKIGSSKDTMNKLDQSIGDAKKEIEDRKEKLHPAFNVPDIKRGIRKLRSERIPKLKPQKVPDRKPSNLPPAKPKTWALGPGFKF